MSDLDISKLCSQVLKLGREGATINMMAYELDLSLTEIAELRRLHKEFDDAITKALEHSLGFHERRLSENVDNKAFSSTTATAILRAAWPRTYESAVYRKDAASKEPSDSGINFQQEVDDLIRQLRALE
jgi:hypothetical protein